jgi:hypothetical protein
VLIAGSIKLKLHKTVNNQANAVQTKAIQEANCGCSEVHSAKDETTPEITETTLSKIGNKLAAIVSLISFKLLCKRIIFHSAVSQAVLLKSL